MGYKVVIIKESLVNGPHIGHNYYSESQDHPLFLKLVIGKEPDDTGCERYEGE